MQKPLNQLFSERFKSARLMKGFSLQDLAEKLNNVVSRQALHRYEKGEVIPDGEFMDQLCNVFNVRPDFFFSKSTVEISNVNFRASIFNAREESRIKETLKEELRRYSELESITQQRKPFKNPLGTNPKKIESFDDVEDAANKIRQVWKLGDDAVSNAAELLEENQIKVIFVESTDDFDGLAGWVNEMEPVIALNNREKPTDRIRFTLFHELSHICLKFPAITDREKETYCHQFAAAMLLPAKTARKELTDKRNRITVNELSLLKQQYGISVQAIALRAKDLEIITANQCKVFFDVIRHLGWKREEPVAYEGTEKSLRFDKLLHRALAEELISVAKAAALKNMKTAEFRNFLNAF